MNKELFAALCYAILMENDQGIGFKSPEYIEEKVKMLNYGYDAYTFLDRSNQWKLLRWFERWHMDLPEEIKQYEEEKYE